MTSRGGRGRTGDKPKRFMMVGTKDTLPAGPRSGVVAPVPINTPSLRQEIHGAKEDNSGIGSINRSSAGIGWGSAAGGTSASAGNVPDSASTGGRGTRANTGGDDAFTRHFPDLRTGLEQAERLDAVTKASTKVAPLRKPKPESANDQGPSLRPRAMLKPTGSAGGGSAATAAAQAAIAEAVHNRSPSASASVPKNEEFRRKSPSSAAEMSGGKSRWTERPPLQEGGGKGRDGGTRGGAGGRGGGGAWETSAYRERGGGMGEMHNRDRKGPRDSYQDKDFRKSFRQGSERIAGGSARVRESSFGSGAHHDSVNSGQDSQGANVKPLATTYVRQHGPPPRRATAQAGVAQAQSPTQQQDQAQVTQQPTRSSAYSATTRPEPTSEAHEPPKRLSESSSNWRSSSSPSAQPTGSPDASAIQFSVPRSRQQARGAGNEGQIGEQGDREAPSQSYNAKNGETSRFERSWGAPEHGRAAIDRNYSKGKERTLSEKRKEYVHNSRSPSSAISGRPVNSQLKEVKDESRASRRWNGEEEHDINNDRLEKSIEDGDVDSSCVVAPVASAMAPSSPSQSSSWREAVDDGWGVDGVGNGRDAGLSAASITQHLEEQKPLDGTATSVENTMPLHKVEDTNGPVTLAEGEGSSEDHTSVQGSLVVEEQLRQAQQAPQAVLRTTSWEPQLHVGTELWEPTGHGRDGLPDSAQGPGQMVSSGSGNPSQPWSDPWGTSGFGLPSGGDQTSRAMSFLGNEPTETQKGRYLPPALRNSAPAERNRVEHEAETIPPSLSRDVATADVPNPDLVVIPGISSGSTGVGATHLFEQQQQTHQKHQPPQQQQEQRPQHQPQKHGTHPQQQTQSLGEWQHGTTSATSHHVQERTGSPADQPLHQQRQQQAIHQSHQVQCAQSLHLGDQPHIDRNYRPSSSTAFSFQNPDRRQHPMQDSALHHQFQAEPFRGHPAYHSQDQTGRAPVPDHLQRPHFQPDDVHHFNQLQQIQQQPVHVAQHRAPHSLHQTHHQQSQQQQGHHQQGYQQGQQPQLPPGPLGGQVAHSRQQPQHHPQDMGRQTNQAQHLRLQPQQRQQQMSHPSSAFMMSSQGIGYSDPRATRGESGLGGLPVPMTGVYRDVPQPGSYGFNSPDQHRKR